MLATKQEKQRAGESADYTELCYATESQRPINEAREHDQSEAGSSLAAVIVSWSTATKECGRTVETLSNNTLIVAVRGWTNTGDLLLFGRPGGEFPTDTLAALQSALPTAIVWAPELNLTMFSMEGAEEVAQKLYDQIDAKVAGLPAVDSIVLLGYSAGSLLVRRVFCKAHGADLDGKVRREPVHWARFIHRIVILGGITRGWEYSSASPAEVRFFSPLLFGLARFVGWWKSLSLTAGRRLPFIWQIQRGAPFVISTRIQYIEVMRNLRRQQDEAPRHPLRAYGLPSTIFLLGARDEYISPADCTELGPREEFAYAELRDSNHIEAVQLGGRDRNTRLRRIRVLWALRKDFAKLKKRSWVLPPGDIDDYSDPMDLTGLTPRDNADRDSVEHAVLVVHGIRDNGFWTKRVAREIKTHARRQTMVVRAPSPSYGFFSMWDFVRPSGRKNATYWFMERYADVRSYFPNACVSFVGHSNGTYIAAHAMTLCPAIQFERIVFAGSVVRRDYPWKLRTEQVKGVLNYVGMADSVVAFLPAVFEALRLRWLDVGGAGAFGFNDADPPPAVRKCVPEDTGKHIELTEVRYASGGHGGAISERFWPEIAEFVLSGQIPKRGILRGWRLRALFACAPIFTAAGLAFAIGIMALPILVAAAVAVITELELEQAGPDRSVAWLTPLILQHRLLWPLVAVGILIAAMFASRLLSRFLREW